METLISARHHRAEGHLHDASEHGFAWATLNELLHVIVFVFTLFGMIQFKVKFIRMIKLVKLLSRAIITYNWYLSIKFASIALLMYSFNIQLEQSSIELASLNCSLGNYASLMEVGQNSRQEFTPPRGGGGGDEDDEPSRARNTGWMRAYYLPHLAWLLDLVGGPYRVLGNRATLMYGVYSIAIYIMLAIFPLELMYFLDVGFNFIRFVLSDPGCMNDLYEKRNKHLARLSSWSRNQTDSLLTRGAKMILNQRELRSATGTGTEPGRRQDPMPMLRTHAIDLCAPTELQGANQNQGLLAPGHFEQSASGWAQLRDHSSHCRRALVGQKFAASTKQLKARLATNHSDKPRYQVVVANRNLQKFKPFVRSDNWFKASMIIYPIFIFFYFITLIVVIGLIQYYFESSLNEEVARCGHQRKSEPGGGGGANRSAISGPEANTNWFAAEWSLLDRLTYHENIYTVFVLSCASSFYCSYYYGTILELSVWMRELSQQLALSTNVIELTDALAHSTGGLSFLQAQRLLKNSHVKHQHLVGFYVNDFGGLSELFPGLRSRQTLLSDRLRRFSRSLTARGRQRQQHSVGSNKSAYLGGPTRLEAQDDSKWPSFHTLSKAKLRELMSIRLLTKKETLLRATYVNMCLFFDELHETRFMTTTILRRTTQLASGFAFMASVTRSQFKANYWHLNYLLASTFIIFNVYLACAAFINSYVNKMLVQIHSLISASLRTGSEDADLFEFWLRHVGSFGQDKDVTAYNIYGYKVTWSTIINVSSRDGEPGRTRCDISRSYLIAN